MLNKLNINSDEQDEQYKQQETEEDKRGIVRHPSEACESPSDADGS